MNAILDAIERRPWRASVLAVTLCWLFLYWPFLSAHRIIGFDSLEQFYPTVFFNSQSIRSGDWPWWNPHIYAGFPQIADPQGMLFAPLLMVLMVGMPSPTPAWFDVAVLIHLLLGALGVIAIARASGLHAVSGVLGAVIYIAGGPASARLQHTPIILAYAWLPWCVLLAQRIATRSGWTQAAALGVVLGALWVQLVQATYLFSLFIAAVGLLAIPQAIRRSKTRREAFACLGRGAFAALVGAALASPQLLSTLAALPYATRTAFPIEVPIAAAAPLQAWWTLVDPNHYGSLAGRYTLAADPTESFMYWGAVPLAIGIVAMVSRSGASKGGRMTLPAACGVALLLCVAYAFVWPRFVYVAAYAWLPGIDYFRRPSDALFLAGFSVSVLTAFLLDAVLRSARAVLLVRLCLGLAGVLYAANAVADILLHRPIGRDVALLAIAVAMGLVQWRRATGARRIAMLLVILAAVDLRILISVGRLNSRDSDVERFYGGHAPLVSTLRARLARDRQEPAPRVETAFTHENLWANGGEVLGYENTQGYNPFLVRAYLERLGAQANGLASRPWTPWLGSHDARLFDVLGVRYVVSNRSERPGSLRAGRFRMLAEDGSLALWENTAVLPRILTPARAERVDGEGLRVRTETTDFEKLVLVEARSSREIGKLDAAIEDCTSSVHATVTAVTNTTIGMDVESSPGAGWIVLSDLDYPGWVSSIDGKEQTYFRANGLFRALCVPAGEHHVEFRFEPTRMLFDGNPFVRRWTWTGE